MENPSDELMEFALFSLDHAANSVIPEGGPLVPFAVVESDGQRSLQRFAGDLVQGQERARQSVASGPSPDLAAVAWDGYLTLEGERSDAVFVEASRRGEAASVILAQRYGLRGLMKKKSHAVGNAALVGRGDPLFATG